MRTRRNEFTAQTKRDAFERSNGICECHLIPHVFKVACGLPLGDGNTFYEHIDPDRISSRNDLANCAVLTRGCWRYKSNSYDKPTIARTNHRQDRARGIKRAPFNPLPGARRDPFKFKFGSTTPIDRKTGEPYRWR
jgi:hypothetical protein